MVAVKGIYQGGDTVKLNDSFVPVHGPYEVVVAFLNPLHKPEDLKTADEKRTRRQEAFERFMQYRGTPPPDFDYKKELTEYRDERYGHFN